MALRQSGGCVSVVVMFIVSIRVGSSVNKIYRIYYNIPLLVDSVSVFSIQYRGIVPGYFNDLLSSLKKEHNEKKTTEEYVFKVLYNSLLLGQLPCVIFTSTKIAVYKAFSSIFL